MERAEIQDTLALLQEGRGFCLAALVQAEAQGDIKQAARSRRNLERADAGIALLEKALSGRIH